MFQKAFVLAFLFAVLAGPANAHEQEKGPNGGPVKTVAGKHVELTTTGNEITVYLNDEAHAPIATAGGSGTATIQQQGKTQTYSLTAGDGNRLVGKSETPIGKGARVVVSAKLADGKSLQARFVVN